jgi:hypothetical protein
MLSNVGASGPLVQGRHRYLVSKQDFCEVDVPRGPSPIHDRLVNPSAAGARSYILLRRPCSRADKCAPVSSNSPVRKAQNIRLADKANGP